MKLNEWQLLALIVGTFAAVIVIDVLIQYQGNAEFRANFPKLPTAGFAKSRAGEMVQQEMTVHPAEPTFVEQATDTE